jgi:hypothetical protein
MLKRTLWIAFALLILASPRAQAVPVISVSSEEEPVVGSAFNVRILITGALELTSWQFDLGYNPAIVQAVSVTEGCRGNVKMSG